MSQRDAHLISDGFHSVSYVKMTRPRSIGCSFFTESSSIAAFGSHVLSAGCGSS